MCIQTISPDKIFIHLEIAKFDGENLVFRNLLSSCIFECRDSFITKNNIVLFGKVNPFYNNWFKNFNWSSSVKSFSKRNQYHFHYEGNKRFHCNDFYLLDFLVDAWNPNPERIAIDVFENLDNLSIQQFIDRFQIQSIEQYIKDYEKRICFW